MSLAALYQRLHSRQADANCRRPIRMALRVEELERRLVPAITVVNQTLTAPGDVPTTFSSTQLLAGDSDANVALKASSPTAPTNATLVDNGDGTFAFSPAAGFSGNTAFNYTVGPAAPQTPLTAGDVANNDTFGISASIDADTAIIGAPGKSGGGAAYIFVRSGAGWVQQAELTDPAATGGDQFGAAVAINGNTAVVGAPGTTVGANASQGAAYVFVRSGTTWPLQQQIADPTNGANELFGAAVAVTVNRAVIGAPGTTVGANTSQGEAYVFDRSGTVWSENTSFVASDPAPNRMFGFSVALDGDVLVGEASGAGQPGAVYVFRDVVISPPFASWMQVQELTASDGATADDFGYSVSLSGNTAIVGAPFKTVNGHVQQGAAYVFVFSATSYSQKQELSAADGAANDEFGLSVSVNGNTAVVGAPGKTAGQGAAYEFVESGTSFTQQQELFAADGTTGDSFGQAASVSGDTALVGASNKSVNGHTAGGRAYVQELATPVTAMATVTVSPPGALMLVATAGSGQSAGAGAPFATPLQVTVKNASGTPVVAGISVTFTAPSSGASGTFPGAVTSVTVTTNASGVAAAPTFTAGPAAGTYNVTATAGGGSTTFTLTNSPSLPAANFDELGAYRPSDGSWSLDSNAQFGFQSGPVAGPAPLADRVISSFSPPGSNVVPVSGDWTGLGANEIGDFEDGTWHLDVNNSGILDTGETFNFGTTGDVPVPGRYLAKGQECLAVFRSLPTGAGEFLISDTNWLAEAHAGQAIGIAQSFIFGAAGDRVVVGDWNGAGLTEVGVFRSAAAFGAPSAAVFSLDVANDHSFDSNTKVFIFGSVTDGVVIGDWDGSGTDKVGVYRPAAAFGAPGTAVFSLDQHGQLDFNKDGNVFLFGLPTDKYVTGRWAYTTGAPGGAAIPAGAALADLAAALLASPTRSNPAALDAYFASS